MPYMPIKFCQSTTAAVPKLGRWLSQQQQYVDLYICYKYKIKITRSSRLNEDSGSL